MCNQLGFIGYSIDLSASLPQSANTISYVTYVYTLFNSYTDKKRNHNRSSRFFATLKCNYRAGAQ